MKCSICRDTFAITSRKQSLYELNRVVAVALIIQLGIYLSLVLSRYYYEPIQEEVAKNTLLCFYHSSFLPVIRTCIFIYRSSFCAVSKTHYFGLVFTKNKTFPFLLVTKAKRHDSWPSCWSSIYITGLAFLIRRCSLCVEFSLWEIWQKEKRLFLFGEMHKHTVFIFFQQEYSPFLYYVLCWRQAQLSLRFLIYSSILRKYPICLCLRYLSYFIPWAIYLPFWLLERIRISM